MFVEEWVGFDWSTVITVQVRPGMQGLLQAECKGGSSKVVLGFDSLVSLVLSELTVLQNEL